MQRIVLSLMALTLCFTACKKKDDTLPETNTQLKSITGADARSFEYNADGTLSKIEGSGRYLNYKYENGKMVAILMSKIDEPDVVDRTCKLTYEGSKVVKYVLAESDDYDGWDSLTYNAKGVVETRSFYALQEDKSKRLWSTDSLFWKDGNLELVQSYDFDIDTRQLVKAGMQTMTYDDKKNPMYGIQGYSYNEIGYGYRRISANNLVTFKVVDRKGVITTSNTMTMEYNDKGYVTKITTQSKSGSYTSNYNY
jgi:hypothetical protein